MRLGIDATEEAEEETEALDGFRCKDRALCPSMDLRRGVLISNGVHHLSGRGGEV